VLQVSCLGVEEHHENNPFCLVLTSRGTDASVTRFIMQASSPEIQQAWLDDVVQILETQRNFLNGYRVQCFFNTSTHSWVWRVWVMWHLFLSTAALQSPIEYQRKESKSNSLGRNVKSLTASASGLRPHSSASMERRQQPYMLSYNTSLPSLHPARHSPASKVVSVQEHSLRTCVHFEIFLTSLISSFFDCSLSLSSSLVLVLPHLKQFCLHFRPTSSSVCAPMAWHPSASRACRYISLSPQSGKKCIFMSK